VHKAHRATKIQEFSVRSVVFVVKYPLAVIINLAMEFAINRPQG
jgi:hypothetical protein